MCPSNQPGDTPAEPILLDRVCVVLVGTRNPLNIGAAARAMSNFGCLSLRVVRPWSPAFREARSAVGAAALLASAQEFDSIAEAVADCTLVVGTTAAGPRELLQPIHALDEGAVLLHRELHSGRAALLFGSEKVGLSRDDLSHCHWLMRIPTREEHRSMNLGQSVAVCLYELARQHRRASALPAEAAEPATPAAGAAIERYTATLLDILSACDYFGSTPSPLETQKIRRLVRRLKLSSQDAELWLGMLRQILWKTRSPGPVTR